MSKYTVKQGVGIIVLRGKGYGNGDAIELTEKQFERLKDKVDSKEVKEVKQGKVELEELSFDKLKEMTSHKNVEGTGKNGAITKKDLINALDQ